MTPDHADIYDLKSLIYMMNFIRSDRILDFAAEPYVLDSFLAPADTLQVNVIGTTNLLDTVHWAEIEPLINIYRSSEVYG